MTGRVRIWSFTALVLAAGLLGTWIFTMRAAPAAAEQVAATLRSGSLQFETGTRLLARQVRDVAAVASRDPALAGAPDPREPAEAAVRGAAALLDVEMGRAPLVGFASERGAFLRVGEKGFAASDALTQAILGPGGAPRHVRVDDAIYAVAVVPAGKGAAIAFGLPIDPRWTERLQAATGADLTLVGPTLVSTLPPGEAALVVEAARKGQGGVVDAGHLAPVSLSAGLPALPVLLARAPAYRARALSLSGIEGPAAVISAPTARAWQAVGAFQQLTLLSLLLLALLGLAMGLASEPVLSAHVPLELASVADRISRGDFEVRIPRMSGTFGTLAAALARAVDAARLARIGQAVTPGPSGAPLVPPAPAPTLDVPLHAVPPDEATGSRRLDEPFSGPGLAPPVTPTPQPVEIRPPFSSAAEAVLAAQQARAGQPRTTQPLGVDAASHGRPTPPVRPVGSPAVAGNGASRGVSQAPAGSDEALWQPVYQEFLRVRAECGESVEGITWDRFRDKLRRNRDTLAQKYACRTVRFQVYVKDGKAALKATPVR